MSHTFRVASVRASLALLMVSALLFTHCGSSSSNPTAPSAQTVSSVALSLDTSGLFKRGGTAQLSATATMSGGATQDMTASCTNWASDNTSVATVSTSGLVTAQNSGSATLTVTCQSVQGRTVVALNVATKATPAVSLSSASLGFSKDTPFQPLVIFKIIYAESSRAFGYNVNFMNFSVKTGAGATVSSVNFGPDMFASGAPTGWKAGDPYIWPAWGNNHVDAAGNKFACFVSASFTPMPSSVTLTWQTSVQDDTGVAANFSGTNSLTPNSGTYSCDETHGIVGTPFIAPLPQNGPAR